MVADDTLGLRRNHLASVPVRRDGGALRHFGVSFQGAPSRRIGGLPRSFETAIAHRDTVRGMRRRLPHIIAVAGCVLVVAVSWSGAGAATPAQLRHVTLSISDMPAGWVIDHSSASGGTANSTCFKGFKKSASSEVQTSVTFRPSEGLPEVFEKLKTGPRMTGTVQRFIQALDQCHGVTITANGQAVHYRIGRVPFATFGSQSAAYAMTFSLQHVQFAMDIVVFQVGSVAGMVGYASIGTPDNAQAYGFVKEAVNKVEGKPYAPPTPDSLA